VYIIVSWSETFMPKFMMTLNAEIYSWLKQLAEKRGITVQELIRAVVIPDWLETKAKGG